MDDCIFCKILEKKIPSQRVVETPEFVAFKDVNPQAPNHILIVPRRHIPTVNDLTEGDKILIGEMVLQAQSIAKDLGISEEGYRLVLNCNRGAGQTVFHLHLHLLAGRPFSWPPG
ncbi:MAG: histidine triad nucleotide-binding protein [Deltaproteobacteria bacterium]|nr:histidine triad nucleotide-binding protein [Deltaproteobacteria bacterium]